MDTAHLAIANKHNKNLYIHYHQWGTEKKFMNISKYQASKWQYPKDLPTILVPQNAYKFVAAMDELICQLPVEEPKHKEGDELPLILATQMVAGDRYDFELSAWHQQGDQWNFEIRSVPKSEEHQDQLMYFPFWTLPWMRAQMVKMLAKHDGSEQIDDMPIIREWATRDAPNIKQREQQPGVKQEQQVKYKKADDAEDCSCST